MSKVIESVKNHISKVYPEAQDVEVRIERDPLGEFVSKIHVRSREGVFHAAKKAATYRRSVDMSYHAILRQIQKIREKKKFKSHSAVAF